MYKKPILSWNFKFEKIDFFSPNNQKCFIVQSQIIRTFKFEIKIICWKISKF